jgi:ubiquinone/menaquinone biosynthesis C-methylase UbiE
MRTLAASTLVAGPLSESAGASFDRLAPCYLLMERLLAGKKLQRCRTVHLPQPAARSVLVLGPGRGGFLPEFFTTNYRAEVTCVDLSARMLAHTRARVVQNDFDPERLRLVHGNVLEQRFWEGRSWSFDLVVSHFFLDCFQPQQLEFVISKVAAVTKESCAWLVADFRLPERGLWRLRAQMILRLAYTFFRVTTKLPARCLTPPEPYLTKQGFTLQNRQLFDQGLLHSDLWERGDCR